jgi:hypothetical protein
MPYKACIQNVMKADRAYNLGTTCRHSICLANMENSCRRLCEHSGTHMDTRHSVESEEIQKKHWLLRILTGKALAVELRHGTQKGTLI